MPILEPEVSIKAPDKKEAETILLAELKKGLDALPAGRQVMFKLTLPDVPDLYAPLIHDKRVLRVVALSGGYSRADACRRLAQNHGMIASFSRAPDRGPETVDERRRVRQGARRGRSTRFTPPPRLRSPPRRGGSGRRVSAAAVRLSDVDHQPHLRHLKHSSESLSLNFNIPL